MQDTLSCGDGACDETVVRSIIEEAGERIQDLIQIGVEFEKDDEGTFSFVAKVDIPRNAFCMPKTQPGRKSNGR